MQHPVIARMRENGQRRAAGLGPGIHGAHIGRHQPHSPHRFMDGRDAVLGELGNARGIGSHHLPDRNTRLTDHPLTPWVIACGTNTSPRIKSRAVRSSAARNTSEGFRGFMVNTTVNSPLGCSTETVLASPSGTRA